MLPTMLGTTEIILENTWTLRRNRFNIQRGDLVTHRSMYDPTKYVCKRVIGLPGDTVCVYPEKALNLTDQVKPGYWSEVDHVIVPAGHVWVSGDNALNSRDSREFGPIPMGLVRGKVFARVQYFLCN